MIRLYRNRSLAVAAQNREWGDSAKLWAMYDMKNLEKLKDMEANAPEAMKAFRAFDKAAMSPGAISGKHKELMALAVAFTTQCPYCIEIHSKKARQAGASEQEISEVVFIAAALRAGAAVTHGTHALA